MLKEERHMEKYKVILVDDEIEAIQAMSRLRAARRCGMLEKTAAGASCAAA